MEQDFSLLDKHNALLRGNIEKNIHHNHLHLCFYLISNNVMRVEKHYIPDPVHKMVSIDSPTHNEKYHNYCIYTEQKYKHNNMQQCQRFY